MMIGVEIRGRGNRDTEFFVGELRNNAGNF
jgi:hypothetical protein